MSAASYIAVEMALGAGERTANHPAVTILIVCGMAIAIHLFFRSMNAHRRRERERER